MSRFFGFGCEIAFACGSCIGCTAKGMTCPACLVQPRQEPQSTPIPQPKPKTRDMSSLSRSSQNKKYSQNHVHSQSQKPGTCHCYRDPAQARDTFKTILTANATPRRMSSLSRSSQSKSQRQNQLHSQTQKPGKCHRPSGSFLLLLFLLLLFLP